MARASQYFGIVGPSGLGINTYFDGAMDDIRIYNYALSAAEVQGLYTAVPEPSTYAALTGLTALGFAAMRRRKRRNN